MGRKKTVKQVKITLEGFDDGDIETAINEVRRLILDGFQSGTGSNDRGAYHFETLDETAKSLHW